MRVLSIDFDWVMEPCIEVYNDFSRARHVIGAKGAWEDIEQKIPMIHQLGLEMDYKKYQELYYLIMGVIQENPNIKIAIRSEHDMIIPIIKSYFSSKDYTLSLINVDHHHDLGYVGDTYEECGCANWVMHLARDKNIPHLSYQWIHNTNSEMGQHESIPCSLMENNSTQLVNIDIANIDLLFLCSSWEWVPMKYGPLFDILQNIIRRKSVNII